MADRRISIETVEARVNKKKSTIYARMKDNKFPQRNIDGWLESEVDYYVAKGMWPPASNDANHTSAA